MSVTEVVQIDPGVDYSETIRQAADILRRGGLVVFPTETVYGVGARADMPRAVDRLRAVKDRHDEQPFTVHIGRKDDVHRFVPDLRGMGRRLVDKGWPGPLTLIFSVDDPASAPAVADLEEGLEAASAMYADGAVGLRCPDDSTAADLLSMVEAPVVAASANRRGQRPPANAARALAELDGLVDLVLDGGTARYAKASTIVRVNGDSYEMVREGVYDERTLRRLASVNVLMVCTGNTCRSPMAEALFRKLAAERLAVRVDELEDRGVQVRSAGTFGGSGAGASPEAVEVMRRYGLDISGHRSQALTADLVRQADHVLTMTTSHLRTVVQMVPEAERYCRVIGDHDVADPIGQSVETYARCAAEIESALREGLSGILT